MPGHGETVTILVLENDRADAELSVLELERAMFVVRADFAASEAEFRERIRSPTYDVVLADYRLPAWTGMDALALLRARGLDVPLILVTGTLGEEHAVDCVKAGAADYVLKSHIRRLPMVVRRALDERRMREERARAMAALAESEQLHRADSARLQALMDNANDGISLLTPDGTVFEANPRLCALLGRPASEILGHEFREFGPPGAFAVKSAEFAAAVARGSGTVADVEMLRPDGTTVIMDFSVARVSVGPEEIVLSIARDMTETRRLEAQFRQAQKMEAVGRLAGGVAHDFNNLLTVILSYANLALSEAAAGDPKREDLDEIRLAAERAAELTRQLLMFSRQQVVKPRLVIVDDIVTGAANMLRRVIGEDVRLTLALGGGRSAVLIDPGQLEQIVMNLAVNGRDAMRGGGTLTIETTVLPLAGRASGTDAPSGESVRLTMRDTGCGMDAATQSRIFEPFFTTKGPGEGTGLGLSTVYAIVTQANGALSVQSELGKGSAFSVDLPTTPDAAAAAHHEPADAMARGTEVVLVTEDDAAVRSAVCGILTRAGYSVLEAPSAMAALGIGRKHRGPIHLLLTDVVMPVINGRQLADELSATLPAVKVLYMSGYTDDQVIRQGVESAAISYIEKPFTPDTLTRRVREVLDS